MKDPRLTPYHFAVYCALVAHAEVETGDVGGKNGSTGPSAETIAGYFEGDDGEQTTGGISERTVRYCIRDLRRWRYIDVEEQPGKASLYRVLAPPTLAPPAGVTSLTPAGPAGDRGRSFRGTAAGPADEQELLTKNPRGGGATPPEKRQPLLDNQREKCPVHGYYVVPRLDFHGCPDCETDSSKCELCRTRKREGVA